MQLVYYYVFGVCWQLWMPFCPPLLPADKPTSIKHRGQYKNIDFYITLLNLTKPFDSGLKKWMCKAARHSGGVVSLNLRRWRGKQLHHHGGGVCWLFVLLWMDLWRHETMVCKKMVNNNPKEGLCGVTFWPALACTTPQQLNWKKISSSPRAASVFVSPSVILSVSKG